MAASIPRPQCAICQDLNLAPRVVRCGHMYCHDCWQAYVSQAERNRRYTLECPECRQSMTIEQALAAPLVYTLLDDSVPPPGDLLSIHGRCKAPPPPPPVAPHPNPNRYYDLSGIEGMTPADAAVINSAIESDMFQEAVLTANWHFVQQVQEHQLRHRAEAANRERGERLRMAAQELTTMAEITSAMRVNFMRAKAASGHMWSILKSMIGFFMCLIISIQSSRSTSIYMQEGSILIDRYTFHFEMSAVVSSLCGIGAFVFAFCAVRSMVRLGRN